MNSIKGISLAACIALTSNLAWACTAPDRPELPDPETAVTPQMVKAQNDVKAYLAAAEAFLECNKSHRKHNKVVDEMHELADDFNAILRKFKARMSG